MNLHRLTEPPDPALAHALAEFEREFTYPLGPGRSFRIDHGADYGRFFRAMGDAACFVVEQNGRVVGAVSAALRPLWTPTGEERRACYIGDLKVAPGSRGGVVLRRVMQALAEWAIGSADCAYGVVMEGTAALPTEYSGRLGMPGFEPVAQTTVLRLSTLGGGPTGERADTKVRAAPLEEVFACFRELSRGCFAVPPGQSGVRSRREPVGLLRADGGACAILEDTLLAKRLWADDGVEMVSAHVSALAFRTPEAGADVVAEALSRCAASGVESAFVAVAPVRARPLLTALGAEPRTVAPATVYAAGLEAGREWNLTSAEI